MEIEEDQATSSPYEHGHLEVPVMKRLAERIRGATLSRVRPQPCLLLPVLLLSLPAVASAGVFGGFSDGNTYRKGDSICTATAKKDATAACTTSSVADLAKMSFKRGTKQRGSSSLVTVQKKGTTLHVVAADGGTLASWDAGQVIGGVGDVFLGPKKQWVAIEFQTRFAGRAVEDVVLLPIALPTAAPVVEKSSDAKSVEKNSDLQRGSKTKSDPPGFREAMTKAARFARKRRSYDKAEAALKNALKLAPGHPEALFQVAILHAKRKNYEATIDALTTLSKSKHEAMVRWRVEARFDVRFKALRGNPAFRKAVGITRGPDETPSLYERLVALGGRWEQEAIPCEQPQVNLTLRRDKKQRFDLVIRSKCQGMAETTRLDGTWLHKGAVDLALRFPNMESEDDNLTCRVELCADESGEDCVRCQPDPESEFLLRTVRR